MKRPLQHCSSLYIRLMTLLGAVLPNAIRLRHSCVAMPKPQGTFKLRVKIDGQEFEAEGQSDLVGRQFEAFRLMIQGGGFGESAHPRHSERAQLLQPVTPALHADEGRHDSNLSTLFRTSPQTQSLTLRQPPGGRSPEADAVLLLLFGHKQLRDEDEVPVTVLTEALKQSGCPVKRLDRILMSYTKDHSVVRTGRGKGGKYRLTNPGLKKAEALVQELSSTA
jgi:hypothetical protein